MTPFPTLERLIAPVVRDGSRWIERWGSPSQELRACLRRAGGDLTVEQFRAHQVVWGVTGMALGTALAVLLAATRGSSPVALVVLIASAGVGGAAARDCLLTRAVARREVRIVDELPTVAELLALSVGVGEGAVGALERVSRCGHGVMSEELRAQAQDVRSAGQRALMEEGGKREIAMMVPTNTQSGYFVSQPREVAGSDSARRIGVSAENRYGSEWIPG